MESWLTKFGFSPKKEAARLNAIPPEERRNYLQKELATHEIHVIRNHAVSLPYEYWLADDGKIFTNKEHTVELELAEEERDGYYKIGIPKALKLAQDNPGQLVFYYSPIGPASFDEPPHPDYQKPYTDGQLNLIYSDGQSIKDINIPLSQQGEEKWLREIFGEEYLSFIAQGKSEKEKIIRFITNPQLSTLTLDDFLNNKWQEPEMIVFTSTSFDEEKNFSINEILFQLRNSLLGNLKTEINIELIVAEAFRDGDHFVKPETVAQAYFSLMRSVMEKKGVDQLVLSGGCGGSVVHKSDLLDFKSPVEKMLRVSNLSSDYRQQIQTENTEETFPCPNCEKPIPKGKGITTCPHCGMTKEEFARIKQQPKCD
jgi:hypothetical protein